MSAIEAILVLLIVWGVYILPAMIACQRRHPARVSIFVLNLLLGWTFVGWVACLVWALLPIPSDSTRYGMPKG